MVDNKDLKRPRLKKLQGKIDLSDWTLPCIDKINDCVSKHIVSAVGEAIDVAMADERTNATLAAVWSEEDGTCDGFETGEMLNRPEERRPVDPLGVYLSVALGDSENDDPLYVFDIRSALERDIETCRGDGSFAPGLRRIMVAMRELADEIESALPSEG